MFKRKGGGSKAFWTMFKKTALFLQLGFPNVMLREVQMPGIGGEWVSAAENPVGNLSINAETHTPTPYPRPSHSLTFKPFQKCAHELKAFVAVSKVWSEAGLCFEAFGILWSLQRRRMWVKIFFGRVCVSRDSTDVFVFQETDVSKYSAFSFPILSPRSSILICP